MSDLDNVSYFAHRAAEERAKSEQASSERVAAAHAEMAWRYEEMAAGLGQSNKPLPFAHNDARAHQ